MPKTVILPTDRMDSNFKWFNPVVKTLEPTLEEPEFCYYVATADRILAVAEFNETVVVLPYKSEKKMS
jgi:hypothetical protein